MSNETNSGQGQGVALEHLTKQIHEDVRDMRATMGELREAFAVLRSLPGSFAELDARVRAMETAQAAFTAKVVTFASIAAFAVPLLLKALHAI